jgi:hypothetical protein
LQRFKGLGPNASLVIYLGEKDKPPIVEGKIGQKEFRTDTSAFVTIKKNADAAYESKGQK